MQENNDLRLALIHGSATIDLVDKFGPLAVRQAFDMGAKIVAFKEVDGICRGYLRLINKEENGKEDTKL